MNHTSPDNDKPVTRGYLKEVLKRIDESLREYSQALAKLQEQPQGQSYVNTNRVAQIEKQLALMQESIHANTQTERVEEAGQNTLEQETRQLAANLRQELQQMLTRIDRLEQVEKREEYDQNTLERDFRQHEREYDLLERKVQDMEYKFKKL